MFPWLSVLQFVGRPAREAGRPLGVAKPSGANLMYWTSGGRPMDSNLFRISISRGKKAGLAPGSLTSGNGNFLA